MVAFTLDPLTLLLTTAVVAGFCGGLLVLAGGRGGAGVWGAAMLAGAAGLVLLAAGRGDSPVLDMLGDGLVLGATALSWTAARMFAGRRPRIALAAAGPVAWVALAPLPWPGALPLSACCGLGAAYVLASARELRRAPGERLPSNGAAVALQLVHGGIYAARSLDALLGHGRADDAGMIAALILESLLHTVGMAFLLLAMMKERAERASGERLRALALADGLTGIANRRSLDERLATEFRRAQRLRKPVALLMVDVDCFKAFNDSFGHVQGDSCLRAVAQTVRAHAARAGDLAARYGGEEFAVVLSETDIAGAVDVAEAIRAAVQAAPVPGGGRVTVSVGAASMIPAPDEAAETLVALADGALYDAKESGRNQVRSAVLQSAPRRAETALAA